MKDSDALRLVRTSSRAVMVWITSGNSPVCAASRQILYSVDGS